MKDELEALYSRYNHREWVSPDPLQFLFDYPELADREIVGLVASSLAYGRVAHILKSIRNVLDRMGRSPAAYIRNRTLREMNDDLAGFKHRFTTAVDMVRLFDGMRQIIKRHGSLNAGFCSALDPNAPNVELAMAAFSESLGGGYLVPSPLNGSACKRMNLYLRWMVRQDEVDPGGWTGVSSSQLIVPLDVHMGRIAHSLRLTRRKAMDFKTALDITKTFRRYRPDDPIRYDFVLTRFGIRSDLPRRPPVRSGRVRL